MPAYQVDVDEPRVVPSTVISFELFRMELSKAIGEELDKRNLSQRELRNLTGIYSTMNLIHLREHRFNKLSTMTLLSIATDLGIEHSFKWSVGEKT